MMKFRSKHLIHTQSIYIDINDLSLWCDLMVFLRTIITIALVSIFSVVIAGCIDYGGSESGLTTTKGESVWIGQENVGRDNIIFIYGGRASFEGNSPPLAKLYTDIELKYRHINNIQTDFDDEITGTLNFTIKRNEILIDNHDFLYKYITPYTPGTVISKQLWGYIDNKEPGVYQIFMGPSWTFVRTARTLDNGVTQGLKGIFNNALMKGTYLDDNGALAFYGELHLDSDVTRR